VKDQTKKPADAPAASTIIEGISLGTEILSIRLWIFCDNAVSDFRLMR
jgi:hypothetical protein